MHPIKIFFVLLCSSFLIVSCGSSKAIQKKPPVKFHGLILSKDIEKKSSTALPIDQTSDFSSEDPKVVASMNFENLSGENRIRWDWYDPNERLYLSTEDYTIKTAKGKFFKNTSAWHSINLKGDDAATLPGKWKVVVYINNNLAESKTFTIAPEEKVASLDSDVLMKPFPQDWGLIIGIQNYAHLPNVAFAKKDALIMKEYFLRHLRVPEENIITLLDSDATKGRIEGYLQKYIPANVTSDTTLYIYFAGHGAPDLESGDPYLVPHDGDALFIEQTGYKLRNFYSDIEKLDIRQTYVFMDSCFSGSANRASVMLNDSIRPALLNVKDVGVKNDSVVSLSASSKGQTSIAYPDKEHGLFTYYLLKALDGDADSNDDNWVSIKEVYQFVSKQVNRASRRLGAEQNPSISPPLEMLKDSAIGRVMK